MNMIDARPFYPCVREHLDNIVDDVYKSSLPEKATHESGATYEINTLSVVALYVMPEQNLKTKTNVQTGTAKQYQNRKNGHSCLSSAGGEARKSTYLKNHIHRFA
jgi:hypothetical protein